MVTGTAAEIVRVSFILIWSEVQVCLVDFSGPVHRPSHPLCSSSGCHGGPEDLAKAPRHVFGSFISSEIW